MSVCVVRGHAFQPKDMFRAQTPMSGTLDHATLTLSSLYVITVKFTESH